MTSVLRFLVRAFWRVFAHLSGPSPSQLSRAGHHPLFPSKLGDPEPAETSQRRNWGAPSSPAPELPRRLSSGLSGSRRA